MTTRRCSTCTFWQPDASHVQGHQQGQCRRHPPRHSEPIHLGYGEPVQSPKWPTTEHDDWCGEHRERAA